MQNCLLSIDLNTTRVNNQNYLHLLNSINCDSLEIHIYNYIEQKHNKLSFVNGEIIHQYSGSRKKVALDIPQALDIIEYCTQKSYDLIYILCGEYESEFLYNKLNQMCVNYTKINPSSLRQIEDSTIINVDFKNKILNSENNQTTNPVTYHKLSTNTEPNNFALHANTTTNNVVRQANTDFSEQNNIISITNKHNDSKNIGTKLTPEQIKKIYTYIKLKQIKQKIKSV